MDYTIICPKRSNLKVVNEAQSLPPFHEDLLTFIDDLSQAIIKRNEFLQFPEIIAAGYWLRKSSIQRLRDIFCERGGKKRVARGLVFHLAPSNVDTIFMYSLFLSLLVGNTNVVRISSRSKRNIEGLLQVINEVSIRHLPVSNRFLIVNYDHDDEITTYFSKICAMRVIWGGDETIDSIRSLPIPASSHEITFAEKFSMALINAEKYLEFDNKSECAQQAFNDSFWFDQLACSSPRMICWVGTSDHISQAKDEFWESISSVIAQKKYDLSPSGNMDKYVALCQYASLEQNAVIPDSESLVIKRISIPKSSSLPFRDIHCGQGLFIEMDFEELKEVASIIGPKDQTITSFGFNSTEMQTQLLSNIRSGVDRIVPFGQALTFSHDWDGFDLMNEFSRVITLEDAIY
ncbi:MAG: acyl-CoA reductase [Planctomycetes bacterium]|nr:acyl-CoA reductase [Planctomycetota bacterium]